MGARAHLDPSVARALPAGDAAAWRAVAALPATQVFARSRTTDTAAVVLAGAGAVVRKRWTWPRRRDRLKGALRTTWAAQSPARREHDALLRLRALPGGPFAPEPLGWLEERTGGVLWTCVLLTRAVDGATDLAAWLVATSSRAARTRVLDDLARRVRAMHDAGLADFEMHPRNVLVAPDGSTLKVDCAKQRRRVRAAGLADRARDLAALDVGLVRLASARERDAFFRAYGADAALVAAVESARAIIDARESRRLPGAR
jgi:lipopolysaccharide kinase (Kdo/WaaP) family protein